MERVLPIFDEYYSSNPDPIGNENAENSRRLLDALVEHAYDQDSIINYIQAHAHDLINVSKSIWDFYIIMRAVGGRTPAPTPATSPATSRANTPNTSRPSSADSGETRKIRKTTLAKKVSTGTRLR